jgi:hypothetical protein
MNYDVLLTFSSIGLFGPPMTMFFMVLEFCVMVPAMVSKRGTHAILALDGYKVRI